MIITVGGQKYDITNWDAFQKKFLDALGISIVNAIDEQIVQLGVVDKGAGGGLLGSFKYRVEGDRLTVFSNKKHAPFVEFGTAGALVTKVDEFGEVIEANPNRRYPMEFLGEVDGRKKFRLVPGLEDWAKRHGFQPKGYFFLARHIWKFGLQPYAPVRRVFLNDKLFESVVDEAVAWARQ